MTELERLRDFLSQKILDFTRKECVPEELISAHFAVDNMISMLQLYNKKSVEDIKKEFGFPPDSLEPERKSFYGNDLLEKSLKRGIEG
ncbi:MAG: hypothetical protein V1804_01355 [Patescibacteria group bacterium]